MFMPPCDFLNPQRRPFVLVQNEVQQAES
jgi:hypothetical protein